MAKPEVGDILVVIHDFQARSSDELSLAKGDRVELIERDDEFGDGWFLGRHMVNGNSGLFPEVYTRPSPKGVATSPTASKPIVNPLPPTNGTTPVASPPTSTTPTQDRSSTPQAIATAAPEASPVTLPLNSVKPEGKTAPAPVTSLTSKFSYGGGSESLGRINSQSQENPVLHETLTVIDEHITDLSAPQNGALHHATDSGSEYSSHMPDRLSYIQGEETDEEEEESHTRSEVESWTADDVAEYLFTAGVEKKHCEVFRDQEISGEVLLGMDQSSLFLKAFDLGSVGRRLKTWQKIKSLQDEVNGLGTLTRRTTQTYGSEAGSEDMKVGGRVRSRTNTLTNSQRFVPTDSRPGSVHGKRLSQTPKIESISALTPISPKGLQDSPTRPSHQKRPSAASVRELHHSRRHSSTDFRLAPPVSAGTPKLTSSGTFPQADPSHKKQPSFDRNWTMGAASSPYPQRPLSSTGFHDIVNASDTDTAQHPPIDVDRGYFSGTEVDGRKRNVLKKRDSTAAHSHKSSYTEQQRVRSATAITRRSRYGSIDSTRDSTPPSAAQMYYSLTGDHRRTASTNTTESIRPIPPAKDGPSPTVTKLDGASPTSPNRQGIHGDWISNVGKFGGLRAISDAMVGSSKLGSPTDSSAQGSPMRSPSRTGSSTPSGGPSFEIDSPDTGKSPYSATTSGSRKSGKKTKKETSAYLRGLQKVGPREAVKNADYSGWMKKKSSHLMTTWKPRLFVLKGRRLAYYYSEDDTEEKGLIDISFHRVLPADNERLTGLHATLTGASNTPIMPADSNLPTLADNVTASPAEKGTDAMFIFKLMPPRAGLSKAVNFTKPTIHYFAVPNLQQGRTWMAALMKATIDRDDSQPMTTTYQQKTISLTKARAMRHRPPALMNLDEKVEENAKEGDDEKKNGLGISFGEVDSAISGLEKLGLSKVESATAKKSTFDNEKTESLTVLTSPQSA
ncbi:hypothetical protein F5Y04DRAFT_70696 [Hypomontagnella monticulosa]|nr:hypothetical protein F5Y04DRAFT_70696 [Hypomontagnella monticulosa]